MNDQDSFKCPHCGCDQISGEVWSQESLDFTMDADGQDYHEESSDLLDTVWTGNYTCRGCNADISAHVAPLRPCLPQDVCVSLPIPAAGEHWYVLDYDGVVEAAENRQPLVFSSLEAAHKHLIDVLHGNGSLTQRLANPAAELAAYHELHDHLSELIESGRLRAAMRSMPDAYQWLVERLATIQEV